MKKTKTTESEYFECDGCGYVIGLTKEQRAEGVTIESQMSTFRVPWDTDPADEADWVWLEFHFHGPQTYRNDCFRYWAHSPRVMKTSLEGRRLSGSEVDEFMSTMLYRSRLSGVGVERPKEKV